MKKTALLVGIGLTLLLAIPGIRFSLFLQQALAPASEQTFVIPPGRSFSVAARQLEQQGIISSTLFFRLLAEVRGATDQLKAGHYRFAEPATPVTILQRLQAGDVLRYRFTVPEGLTIAEIAERLERAERGDKRRFLKLCRNPELVQQFGIPAASLEGYLFPETYLLETEADEDKLLNSMLKQFQQRVDAELLNKAKRYNLNRHQMVTLASIIQKEAGSKEEMPLISAVFHNRLRKGIPLQADPTVIYGISDFDGNLTRKHLQTPGPYNTYLNRGLPPGPIANPGIKALQAAISPAEVDYLYFVARGDGSHKFSSSLREHNRAVRRFQLRRGR